jgi:hypothetical protein
MFRAKDSHILALRPRRLYRKWIGASHLCALEYEMT